MASSIKRQPRPDKGPRRKDVDLTGQRFARLLVIERAGSDRSGFPQWSCRCDCGNITVTVGNRLRRNRVQSCGCLQKERAAARAFSLEDVLVGYKYASIKASSPRRALAFELSKEEFRALILANCAYCGVAPDTIWTPPSKRDRGSIKCNGIDRIDTLIGYVRGNVAPCCTTCNVAKNSLSVEEFKAWILRIAKFQGFST